MRASITAAVILAMSGSVAVAASSATVAAISKALADPARADQQGDDARRKAADVLAFSGVKPGDALVDFLPGRGYWTRIFTGIVGPRGEVVTMWPKVAAQRAEPVIAALKEKGVKAQFLVTETNLPSTPKPVDLFWTVENYHDIANAGGEPAIAAFNKAVFATLKHGGTYVVIDHDDTPGAGIADTSTKHRIEGAAVKAQVTTAGFQFVGESDALRHSGDDHSKPVFDPSVRGMTDQFVYKFRKP